MQTLGTLIDQLSILNIKLFHQEEIRHPESGSPDEERLAASDKITVLNKQRNLVIAEIDAYLAEVLRDPSKHLPFNAMKDYKKR